jgi:hypothetical protein
MKSFAKLAIATSLLTAAAPALAANEGFEAGNTSGWTGFCTNGAASGYGAFGADSGSYLGYVQAGCGSGVYSTLTQAFHLATGGTISGVVGFQANDYVPYNDDAYLSVNGNNLFTSSVASVGNYGNTPWTAFNFTATHNGIYTLQVGVTNRLDNGFSSGAVIDSVAITGGIVPEPAQWALMLGGFGIAGSALRRKRAVRVTYA